MSQASNGGTEFPTLPPEKLLEGSYSQIEAGLNCVDDPEILMKYMAFENSHQNRTPIQELIRTKVRKARDTTTETGSGHWTTPD